MNAMPEKPETDKLCAVECHAIDCIYNLAGNAAVSGMFCNLKHIRVTEDGKCAKMILRSELADLRMMVPLAGALCEHGHTEACAICEAKG